MLTTTERDQTREIFKWAIEIIDKEFDEGYARKNPALLTGVFATLSEFVLSIRCAG